MLKISGKYGSAIVYSREVSDSIWNKVFSLVNLPAVENSEIRIMPNVCDSSRSIIGITVIGSERVIPSILGEDIGCGTLCIKLKETSIDLSEFDSFLKRCIQIKMNKVPHRYANNIDLYKVRAKLKREDKMYYELGSLGQGSHFIELDKDNEGSYYLVVHSGSGSLGKQIFEYWQGIAYRSTRSSGYKKTPYELYWLEDVGKDLYLEDINRALLFARWNRAAIADIILSGMHLHDTWSIETVHNYISGGILRRGAVSAKVGERVIIPLTMVDGIILGTGRGSKDWNYSAPSGLGRVLRMGKQPSLLEYKKEIDEVYSSCVSKKTIVEYPKNYKSVDEMMSILVETVDTEKIIKSVYNFRAC